MTSVTTRVDLPQRVDEMLVDMGRRIVLIDGYSGSGKASVARELVAIDGVISVSVSSYQTNGALDIRRLRKEVIKPFRRGRAIKGAVQGSAGDDSTDARLLLITGRGVGELRDSLGADRLWWCESEATERAQRLGGTGNVPGATFSAIRQRLEQTDVDQLRERIIGEADLVVLTDDQPDESDAPAFADPGTPEWLAPEADADSATSAPVAAALGESDSPAPSVEEAAAVLPPDPVPSAVDPLLVADPAPPEPVRPPDPLPPGDPIPRPNVAARHDVAARHNVAARPDSEARLDSVLPPGQASSGAPEPLFPSDPAPDPEPLPEPQLQDAPPPDPVPQSQVVPGSSTPRFEPLPRKGRVERQAWDAIVSPEGIADAPWEVGGDGAPGPDDESVAQDDSPAESEGRTRSGIGRPIGRPGARWQPRVSRRAARDQEPDAVIPGSVPFGRSLPGVGHDDDLEPSAADAVAAQVAAERDFFSGDVTERSESELAEATDASNIASTIAPAPVEPLQETPDTELPTAEPLEVEPLEAAAEAAVAEPIEDSPEMPAEPAEVALAGESAAEEPSVEREGSGRRLRIPGLGSLRRQSTAQEPAVSDSTELVEQTDPLDDQAPGGPEADESAEQLDELGDEQGDELSEDLVPTGDVFATSETQGEATGLLEAEDSIFPDRVDALASSEPLPEADVEIDALVGSEAKVGAGVPENELTSNSGSGDLLATLASLQGRAAALEEPEPETAEPGAFSRYVQSSPDALTHSSQDEPTPAERTAPPELTVVPGIPDVSSDVPMVDDASSDEPHLDDLDSEAPLVVAEASAGHEPVFLREAAARIAGELGVDAPGAATSKSATSQSRGTDRALVSVAEETPSALAPAPEVAEPAIVPEPEVPATRTSDLPPPGLGPDDVERLGMKLQALVEILGSEAMVADFLEVEPTEIRNWLLGRDRPRRASSALITDLAYFWDRLITSHEEASARSWLMSPNPTLADAVPIDYLRRYGPLQVMVALDVQEPRRPTD